MWILESVAPPTLTLPRKRGEGTSLWHPPGLNLMTLGLALGHAGETCVIGCPDSSTKRHEKNP